MSDNTEASPSLTSINVYPTSGRKTVLRTRAGHVFQHGVAGADDITEHGTEVPSNLVDKVVEAAKPFGGERYVFPVEDTDQG